MSKRSIEFRVRYKETDQMGVVYYSNYLVWFEVARTEYFRDLGVEYKKIEEEGMYIPVVEAYCRYRAPLRYDDLVTVVTDVAEIGAVRIVFEYEVFSRGKLMATGMTKHAFIDKRGVQIPVPEKVKIAFGA